MIILQSNLNIDILTVLSVYILIIGCFVVYLIDNIKIKNSRILYSSIYKLKNTSVKIYHLSMEFIKSVIVYFIIINITIYTLDLILDCYYNHIVTIMIASVLTITIIHLFKCYNNKKKIYAYDIFIKISILLIFISINLLLGICYLKWFNSDITEIHFLSSIIFNNIINTMELNKILYNFFNIFVSYTTVLFSVNGKYILLPSYWEQHITCHFENPDNLQGSSTQNLSQTGHTTSGLFPPADNNLSNTMLAQGCFEVLNHIERSQISYAKEIKYLATEYATRQPHITEVHMLDVICSYFEYAQWDANLAVRHPDRFVAKYKNEEYLTEKLNKDPKLRDEIIMTTNTANRKGRILLAFIGKLYDGEESIHTLTKSDSLQDKKTALVKLRESGQILTELPQFNKEHKRSLNISTQMGKAEKLLNLQQNSLIDKIKENNNYASVFENRKIPSIMGKHFNLESAYAYLEKQYKK